MGKYNIFGRGSSEQRDTYNIYLNTARQKQRKLGTGRMKTEGEIETIFEAEQNGRQRDHKGKKRK